MCMYSKESSYCRQSNTFMSIKNYQSTSLRMLSILIRLTSKFFLIRLKQKKFDEIAMCRSSLSLRDHLLSPLKRNTKVVQKNIFSSWSVFDSGVRQNIFDENGHKLWCHPLAGKFPFKVKLAHMWPVGANMFFRTPESKTDRGEKIQDMFLCGLP